MDFNEDSLPNEYHTIKVFTKTGKIYSGYRSGNFWNIGDANEGFFLETLDIEKIITAWDYFFSSEELKNV